MSTFTNNFAGPISFGFASLEDSIHIVDQSESIPGSPVSMSSSPPSPTIGSELAAVQTMERAHQTDPVKQMTQVFLLFYITYNFKLTLLTKRDIDGFEMNMPYYHLPADEMSSKIIMCMYSHYRLLKGNELTQQMLCIIKDNLCSKNFFY